MKYTIQEIRAIVNGTLTMRNNDHNVVAHICYDSRHYIENNSLFIALQGTRSGSAFITAAYAKGVRNFIVSDEFDNHNLDANFVYVDDALIALQACAKHYRETLDFPIVGVTGSNGKTIVKEWLSQMLEQTEQVAKSPKSYNSQIGVALSILKLDESASLGIIEAGISTTNEMTQLEAMIQPRYGILTNIGSAHDIGFANRKEKIDEKLLLFPKCELVIAEKCALHEDVISNTNINWVTWGRSKDSDIQILKEQNSTDKTQIEVHYKNTFHSFLIPFSNKAMVQNAMQCICFCMVRELPSSIIQSGLDQLRTIDLRLKLERGWNGNLIINDSYSADYESFEMALQFQNEQQGNLKKIVILTRLSEVVQDQIYKRLAQLLGMHQVDEVWSVGLNEREQDHFSNQNWRYLNYNNRKELITSIENSEIKNSIILLKGARNEHLEEVGIVLRNQQQQCTLKIDFSTVSQNFKYFKKLLQPDVKVMVMVKGHAYGIGAYEISNQVSKLGADYLAVAYTDEGIELRKKGIQTAIMVLNNSISDLTFLMHYNLEPEIYSLEQLKSYIKYLQANSDRELKVHLKLDTGMHRLGFEQEDISELCSLLAAHPQVRIASVFTHLSSSDNKAHLKISEKQIELFQELAKDIEDKLQVKIPIKHCLNTSGILHFPNHQMDMVRLGIGLYGIVNEHNNIQEIATFTATVSQIKKVKKGESIGYNYNPINQDRTIAIINVGYADGIPRLAGNGNFSVVINGRMVPTIGDICMDMTMIDITEIDAASIGKEVYLFGPELSIQRLANSCNTIPYEILAGISKRVKRIYFSE